MPSPASDSFRFDPLLGVVAAPRQEVEEEAKLANWPPAKAHSPGFYWNLRKSPKEGGGISDHPLPPRSKFRVLILCLK